MRRRAEIQLEERESANEGKVAGDVAMCGGSRGGDERNRERVESAKSYGLSEGIMYCGFAGIRETRGYVDVCVCLCVERVVDERCQYFGGNEFETVKYYFLMMKKGCL